MRRFASAGLINADSYALRTRLWRDAPILAPLNTKRAYAIPPVVTAFGHAAPGIALAANKFRKTQEMEREAFAAKEQEEDQEEVQDERLEYFRPLYEVVGHLLQDRLVNQVMHRAIGDVKELRHNLNIVPSDVDPEDVLVLDGTYDSAAFALHTMGLKFRELEDYAELAMLPLKKEVTLIVTSTNNIMPKNLAHQIRLFVEHGGQLITTDRALTAVIEQAFPDYMRSRSKRWESKTLPIVQHVYVSLPPGHKDSRAIPIFKNEPDGILTWLIQRRTDIPHITNPSKVFPLVASQTMKGKGLGSGVVYGFNHGAGSVVHFIPHLFLDELPPGATISKNKILDYFQAKGASGRTLNELLRVLGASQGMDDEANAMHTLETFRTITTMEELLLRCVLYQKQIYSNPKLFVGSRSRMDLH